MTWRLTPRPLVPVLVQAAALSVAPVGCGDDSSGESATASTTDTFPTAGPCAHDPNATECGSTSFGTTGASATETTTVSTTDTFPTAGPCAHDPNAPECASTGDLSTSTTSDTSDGSTGGSTGGTGTGTGSTGS